MEYDKEIVDRAHAKLIEHVKQNGSPAQISEAGLTEEEAEHLGKWFMLHAS